MKSSLQVRLHPKPQIEIRYCVDAEMKLLQSNWVRVEVSNCSSHLHRHFQYPCVWQASGLTARWKLLHRMMCCAIARTCVWKSCCRMCGLHRLFTNSPNPPFPCCLFPRFRERCLCRLSHASMRMERLFPPCMRCRRVTCFLCSIDLLSCYKHATRFYNN